MINIFYEDNSYLQFVHQEALKIEKYFLLDAGEGRDFIDNQTGWYVEDLSGWLIDPASHERFIDSRKNGTAYNDFGDEYVFAIWSKSNCGELIVNFKKY